MLSLLLFVFAVDVITENAREDLINKILYADDFVLMSKSMENLRENFLKSKEAFESKGLKVDLKKTKVMVSISKRNNLEHCRSMFQVRQEGDGKTARCTNCG